MKHPSVRALFEYWDQKRGRRPAPERGDIEPAAIRHVLADTFVLSFEPRMGHPFRLAGTRVCALFARELKGEAFLDLWPAQGRKDIRELLSIVSHESVGVVASVSATSTAGAALNLELLALPLSHHGQTTARLLGVLAPAEPPLWLGAAALVDLRLGTHRYVGPEVADGLAPHAGSSTTLAPRALAGKVRHGFVVYDGGQP